MNDPKVAGTSTRVLLQKVATFVIYQLSWWICIFLAADGRYLLATLVNLGASIVFLVMQEERMASFRTGLIFVVAAMLADGFLIYLTLLSPAGASTMPLPPAWLAAMWFVLGVVAADSLRGLLARPLLFGIVGGPMVAFSYWGAARLGACSALTTSDCGAIGLIWGCTLVVAAHLANKALNDLA